MCAIQNQLQMIITKLDFYFIIFGFMLLMWNFPFYNGHLLSFELDYWICMVERKGFILGIVQSFDFFGFGPMNVPHQNFHNYQLINRKQGSNIQTKPIQKHYTWLSNNVFFFKFVMLGCMWASQERFNIKWWHVCTTCPKTLEVSTKIPPSTLPLKSR